MNEQFLTVTTEHLPGSVTVLTLTGEIDRDSSLVLAEAAEPVLDDDGRRLVIDLSGVTFCDSAGVNLMFRLHRRLAGRDGAASVAGARDFVLRTLTVVNFSRMVAMHPTVSDAIRAASGS